MPAISAISLELNGLSFMSFFFPLFCLDIPILERTIFVRQTFLTFLGSICIFLQFVLVGTWKCKKSFNSQSHQRLLSSFAPKSNYDTKLWNILSVLEILGLTKWGSGWILCSVYRAHAPSFLLASLQVDPFKHL
jgi:hypothetical protein